MNRSRQHQALETLACVALAALGVSVLLTGCGSGLAAGWDWTAAVGWR